MCVDYTSGCGFARAFLGRLIDNRLCLTVLSLHRFVGQCPFNR